MFIWYFQDPCWLMTVSRVVRANTHWGLSYTIIIRIYVDSTTSSLIAWTGRRSTCLVWNSTKRCLGVTFFSVVALLDIPQVNGMKWPRANVMSQDFRERKFPSRVFWGFSRDARHLAISFDCALRGYPPALRKPVVTTLWESNPLESKQAKSTIQSFSRWTWRSIPVAG